MTYIHAYIGYFSLYFCMANGYKFEESQQPYRIFKCFLISH